MKTFIKIGFALLLISVFYSKANAQFILSGELRPRAEFRHGYSTLADEDDKTSIFVSQRTRLNVGYTNEHFKTFLSLQDVRTWGDEVQVGDVASTALHEGWGELFFCKSFSLKAGRQELAYDDHRLLGNLDWVQQARSHDAALLRFNKAGWKADLGAAYNNEKENLFKVKYTLDNYRVLAFLYVNKTFKEKLNMSLLGVTDGTHVKDSLSNDIKYRHTAGPLLTFKTKALELSGSFYYQFGQDVAGKDIQAFMALFNAMYKVKGVTLGAGVDVVSGTDALDAGNKNNNSFNTLYPTNHKFYGLMDYFINLPAHTANGGLIDIHGKVGYKFSEKINAFVDYHYFLLENNVADPANTSNALDKGLGSEIDAVVNYTIFPMVNIQAGYSVMLATSSMEAVKKKQQDGFQNWGWVMLTFKPEFFDSEKFRAKKED